ncbi:MAG: helix-turn-helix domain-containing protein [Subdoligranulum sp.]|nr:helix-turn-helix domain-containing protein [Subdoligranulum sp.]
MDLIKIGKYIAGKRKELGMTQKQLAEKLGMSDKSVSKWERGYHLDKDTTPFPR